MAVPGKHYDAPSYKDVKVSYLLIQFVLSFMHLVYLLIQLRT
jgi:hypothetical protein